MAVVASFDSTAAVGGQQSRARVSTRKTWRTRISIPLHNYA
jgi:hypothetical protein